MGGVWQIFADGETSQRGFFDCDIPAGESGEIKIDYRRPRIDSKQECLMEVSFVLKEDLNWADKGHEIAWEQFKVPTDLFFVQEPENNHPVSASETETQLTISGDQFSYVMDKKTGEFISLQFKGTEYLEKRTGI